MATSCGFEFQLSHLRFESADESNFYEFQWTKKKIFFVLYRAFTFCYHWAWLIAGWVHAAPDIYYTISNWSFFFTGIYFLVAFITALYGIIERKNYTTPTGSTTKPGDANTRNGEGNSPTTEGQDTGHLRFFHKTTWFFHVQATNFVLYVTVLFWALLAPDLSIEELQLPIGQHKHSVQGALMLIDLFLVAIPSRWVHFLYNMLFALFFSIFALIMHFAGVDSAIYGFLNFETNPGLAAGVLVGATVGAPVVLHTIIFALYHLRAFIYRQTVGKQDTETKAKFDAGQDNVAFTP